MNLAASVEPEFEVNIPVVAQYFGPLLLHQRSWIRRRVQTLEILSDRRSHRRTSVDLIVPRFVVPQSRSNNAPASGRYVVLPIALPFKGPLRQFDIVDEANSRVPVLDASANIALGQEAFRRVANEELQHVGVPLSHRVEEAIAILVAERSSGRGASRYQDLLRMFRSDEGNVEYATLLNSWRFMALAWDLSASFALTVVLSAEVGEHRILRYSAEDRYQPVPTHATRTLVRRAVTFWRPPSFDFVVPVAETWSAESYHLEISAPHGSWANEAILASRRRNRIEDTSGPEAELDRQSNVEVVHFVAYNIRRGSNAAVYARFRLHAAGLLTPMLFSAGLSLLIFIVGSVLARTGIRSQTDSPTVAHSDRKRTLNPIESGH